MIDDPYLLIKYAHVLGAILMGAGLLAVWLADLRSRKVNNLLLYAECARFVVLFYNGLVILGAVLLFLSGRISRTKPTKIALILARLKLLWRYFQVETASIGLKIT